MKRTSRILSIVLSAFILLSNVTYSKTKNTEIEIYKTEIAKGITYTRKYIQSSDRKNLYILNADLKNKNIELVFSKAEDRVKKSDTLTNQIERENVKGKKAVAGINADMFEMTSGFSTGPQVRDGVILTGFSSRSEEKIYPVFGITKEGTPFIDHIFMQASLTIAESNASINIDNVNREKFKESIIILNSFINDERKVDFKDYYLNGALTVIKGISQIELGKEYEGVVVDLGINKKDIVIPKDCIVLASNGKKFNWVKDNLKVGDKVKIKVDFDKQIKDVIGTYAFIVKNGKALTSQEIINNGANPTHVNSKRARTAIGITGDNKIIALVVDYGNKDGYISDGATYQELGVFMKNLGAVNAVVLDGGGSTQMNIKFPWEDSSKVVNRLSDGRERNITNGILFVDNSEPSYVLNNIYFSENDIYIYKNSQYPLKLLGYDTNYNKVDLKEVDIKWTIDKDLGKIVNGIFIAGNKAKTGKIVAECMGKKASININVVDKISELKISQNNLWMSVNQKNKFSVEAKLNGKNIIVSDSLISWSVNNNIGKIDKLGNFTALQKGKGEVTAKVGDKAAKAIVYVGVDEMLIDDFEHNDSARYFVEGLLSSKAEITDQNAKNGKYSLKISYDLNEWDRKESLTSNLYPTFYDEKNNDLLHLYISRVKPQKIAVWAYSEGTNARAYVNIVDNNDNVYKIPFNLKMQNGRWTYLTAEIPDVSLPLTLMNLSFVEEDKTLTGISTIYLDDLKFIYNESNDYTPPKVLEFKPKTMYTTNGRLIVKVNDDISGIDPESINIKIDGKNYKGTYSEIHKEIYVDFIGLAEGKHVLNLQLKDKAGNETSFEGNFSIVLEEDKEGPKITNVYPLNSSKVRTNMPRIGFNILDDKTGVNQNDIFLFIDSVQQNVFYDKTSGYGFALPKNPLSNGEHTLTIYAKDQNGNISDVVVSKFWVEDMNIISKNNIIVDVFADTHTKYYLDELIETSNKDNPDLILHAGDIVDADTKEEWDGIKEILSKVSKPFIVTAGNHDTLNNSNELSLNFGDSTQFYTYGNANIITLNSSKMSSIYSTDPTQYEFLKRALNLTNRKNIIILTHVPVKDFINKNYIMPERDIKLLKDIIIDYKSKNKDKNVLVIFGHQHIFKKWNENGVDFIIAGNGSGKRYAKLEDGGYLGFTRLYINDNITIRSVPIVEHIGIKDNKGQPITKIVLPKGSKLDIEIFGYTIFGSYNNIFNLTNLKDIEISFANLDPNIASFKNGTLEARKVGLTTLIIKVGSTILNLPVEVIDKDVPLTKIKFDKDDLAAANGKSYTLTVVGYDIYGNIHIIDNSKIKYLLSGKIGTVKNGTLTVKGNRGNKGEIVAVYKDKRTVMKVQIK